VRLDARLVRLANIHQVVAQLHHLHALIVLPIHILPMMLLTRAQIVQMVKLVRLDQHLVPMEFRRLWLLMQQFQLLLLKSVARLLLLRLAHQLLLLEVDVQLVNSSHALVAYVRTAQQASTSLTQTTVVLLVMIVRQVHMQAIRALLSALLALQEQVQPILVELNVPLVPLESTVILPVRLVAHFVQLASIILTLGLLHQLHALIVLPIHTLLMMLLILALIAQKVVPVQLDQLRALVVYPRHRSLMLQFLRCRLVLVVVRPHRLKSAPHLQCLRPSQLIHH
jgi:hypothetical protein